MVFDEEGFMSRRIFVVFAMHAMISHPNLKTRQQLKKSNGS
jgi:hypothetical protein